MAAPKLVPSTDLTPAWGSGCTIEVDEIALNRRCMIADYSVKTKESRVGDDTSAGLE